MFRDPPSPGLDPSFVCLVTRAFRSLIHTHEEKEKGRKRLRSAVRAGFRAQRSPKHRRNGFSAPQVSSRPVWSIVEDFRLQPADSNLEAATLRSFLSGKEPNSLSLLANEQYLCEVFCFPKCPRTRSRMCCYWDLVPTATQPVETGFLEAVGGA